jgi:hypothetical protein
MAPGVQKSLLERLGKGSEREKLAHAYREAMERAHRACTDEELGEYRASLAAFITRWSPPRRTGYRS